MNLPSTARFSAYNYLPEPSNWPLFWYMQFGTHPHRSVTLHQPYPLLPAAHRWDDAWKDLSTGALEYGSCTNWEVHSWCPRCLYAEFIVPTRPISSFRSSTDNSSSFHSLPLRLYLAVRWSILSTFVGKGLFYVWSWSKLCPNGCVFQT
jgi:hypothetical protein